MARARCTLKKIKSELLPQEPEISLLGTQSKKKKKTQTKKKKKKISLFGKKKKKKKKTQTESKVKKRYLYTYVHSTVYNNQKVEATHG